MQGSLDAVLDRCMRSPRDVKPDVRCALRISAYEAIYLGKDAHAVVDQGVELVRSVAPKAAGLANAVLRKVVGCRRSFPFGEPARDLDALSLQQGFPLWLTELLVRDLGRVQAAEFERASNEPAPVFLYENPMKAVRKRLADALSANDVAGAEQTSLCGVPLHGCLLMADRRDLAQGVVAEALADGRALVSDASAQAVASLCAIVAASKAEGMVDDVAQLLDAGLKKVSDDVSVLELCSGRGTKTIMVQGGIFRLLGRKADRYVSVDNVRFKCDLLNERVAQFGARVDEVVCADLAKGPLPVHGEFDVVLLDAPCSGLGTLRRHPEVPLGCLTPDVIAADAERDAALLAQAAGGVRRGGFLLYATCTVMREEDEDAVSRFLGSAAGERFERVSVFGEDFFKPTLRPGGPDAHFCAVMQRVA